MFVIGVSGLDSLFRALVARGFRVVGPTVRDSTIVYDELESAADLPIGWTDEQAPGRYRLHRRTDGARFGYAVGPHSWKQFLFPARVRLWQIRKSKEGFAVSGEPAPGDEAPRFAFIGVRACELAALEVHDRVLMHREPDDPIYTSRRVQAFTVAVSCTRAGGTCFCASMGTGPGLKGAGGPVAGAGYDLALTEVVGQDEHYFTAEAGSQRGAEVLAEVVRESGGTEARPEQAQAAGDAVARAAAGMGRTLGVQAAESAAESGEAQAGAAADAAADTVAATGRAVRELLFANLEHGRWSEVAERCLACGNCTLVCPTCFCHTVEDTSDVTGEHAERWRLWDSCFTGAFSYVHGGSVRPSIRARYRQWLTHKLASWFDQFGTSGCVGCGRCITWCPVGIDITEEVAALAVPAPPVPAPADVPAGEAALKEETQ